MDSVTSEFLWNSALKLDEVVTPTLDAEIIKIHLRSRWAERLQGDNVILPSTVHGPHSRCKACHSPWTCGQFSLRLVPKKQPKKRTLKLAEKDPSSLTKWQRKLRLLCMKPETNIMELTCLVCKTINRIPMKKPAKITKVDETPGEDLEVKKLKKKKKKRDSFAGLNISAVKTVQDSLTSTPLSKPGNKRKHSTEKIIMGESKPISPILNSAFANGNHADSTSEDKVIKKKKKKKKKSFGNMNTASLVTPAKHTATSSPLSKHKVLQKSIKTENKITPKRNSLMAEFLNSL